MTRTCSQWTCSRRRQKKRENYWRRKIIRDAKRVVGSHLRWIIKGRARLRSITPRRTHIAGYDVFESKQLPYTDAEGKVVDCVVCETPPNIGLFTPHPYMVLSPKSYTELIARVKGETDG